MAQQLFSGKITQKLVLLVFLVHTAPTLAQSKCQLWLDERSATTHFYFLSLWDKFQVSLSYRSTSVHNNDEDEDKNFGTISSERFGKIMKFKEWVK